MSWWVEQILVNTVVWVGVGAAVFGLLVRRRRVQELADAEVVRRAVGLDVTPYQAAEFTGDSPIEVAVWLLLERGYVHIARDGRVRAAIMAKPTPADDPAQAAVYDLLKRNPNGLKLHEIRDDDTCYELCERANRLDDAVPELAGMRRDGLRTAAFAAAYLLPIGMAVSAAAAPVDYRSGAVSYWILVTIVSVSGLPTLASTLFPRSRRRQAQIPLFEHCRRLRRKRFADLGHEEERQAVGVYR
ncbi:MAG: hypothetical protein HOV68_25185, partial [Streptomycetaceae bacterium]|nr:hypothetical protein [Streptomycetaceae bacterium]